MNRRWRIDTALAVDHARARLRHRSISSSPAWSRARDPALAEQVIEALLNNETYFFRDRLPFDLLLGGPVQRLEQARAEREAAVDLVRRLLDRPGSLFAGDELRRRARRAGRAGRSTSSAPISPRSAIERARAGIYSQFEVQRGLPVMQMIRWFEELGGGDWRVVADSCAMRVRFEVRNMIEPPPHPGRFDIILCRNVLLYFAPDMRRLAFNRLAEAIAPDGTLMLGAGETVIGQTERFVSDPDCRGLYRCPAPGRRRRRRSRPHVA